MQIQSLGFITSTPVAPTNYNLWAGAHFTTFNSWNDQNSEKTLGWTMPWARWMKTDGSNPLTGNETNKHASELASLQYGDELNQDGTGTIDSSTMAAMAAAYSSWHSVCGTNFIAYSNFGENNATKAMTPAGLASYMAGANPDMLMFDAYPFQYVTVSTWYAAMQKYRLAALAGIDGTGSTPLPYAQYLDLYRSSYTAAVPQESLIRLQQFASWAFGYTFVTAFVYNKPNNSTVYPAMFSSDGDSQTNAVFGQVAEANRESLNIGPALVRLVSSDVRMIPGSGNTLPAGVANWSQGAGNNNYIVSITPVNGPAGAASGSYADIIIGYFEPLLADNSAFPFADGAHFMIVNGATSGSAANKAQWYHLVFDFGTSAFDSLQVISRDTGAVSLVPLQHVSGSEYSLDWNLEGGTGDLFRFYNSQASAAVGTTITNVHLADNGELTIFGTNSTGFSGGSYEILNSSNAEAPLASWMTNVTGLFGTGGVFSNDIDTAALGPRSFFIIKTP